MWVQVGIANVGSSGNSTLHVETEQNSSKLINSVSVFWQGISYQLAVWSEAWDSRLPPSLT